MSVKNIEEKESARGCFIELEEVLTVADIQKILKVSRAVAYELTNSGVFPILRIGRVIRIPAKTFREWLYSDRIVVSL